MTFSGWMLVIGLSIVAFLLGFGIGLTEGMKTIMKDAIERNKAQYNPKTRKFEWI